MMDEFAASARRLRLAADIVDRQGRHNSAFLIGIVSEGFRSTAGAFEDVAPCAPGELPEELCDAVTALNVVLAAHDFELSSALVGYAVAPVAGENPTMTSLGAVSRDLARQDLDLRIRRVTILRGGCLDSLDDERVSWALRALSTVHCAHERLALEVAADNGKPGNQGRAAVQLVPGARTAPDHRDA